MVDPGGDLRCGVGVKAVQLDQVEAPFGLCGLQAVHFGVLGGREPPDQDPGAVVPQGCGDLDTTGILARSVEDCALLDSTSPPRSNAFVTPSATSSKSISGTSPVACESLFNALPTHA
ncbi:hypothetical protein RKD29_007626 [Streptomyces tendae]|uniref:hypothetical protein n=1 Tax=Streptomyces tendae TaxID=1932 RepID=UPI0038348B62